ncbi:MAG: hypothetical protein NTU95_08990 [Methanothrix sp.]|nr:hypothetical protein [Methanothrix sp.]
MTPSKPSGRPKKAGPRFCRNCRTELNVKNTYSRSGRRVTYCKDCEKLRVQEKRLKNKGCTDNSHYSYTLYKNRPIFFASKGEKSQYLLDRTLVIAGSGETNEYSSIAGRCVFSICRNRNDDKKPMVTSPVLCTECSGILRFNTKIELICEDCGSISDVLLYEENKKMSLIESFDPSTPERQQNCLGVDDK